MPYARKRKFPYRRRTFRPTKYRRVRRRYVGRRRFRRTRTRAVNVVRQTPVVKLHFFDCYPYNSGAGGVVTQTFRGNSIYDADYTGAGGVPSGYTEYAAMYERYQVLGAKIRVRFQSTNATNNPFIGAIRCRYADAAYTLPVNVQQGAMELGRDWVSREFTGTGVAIKSIMWLKMYRSTRSMIKAGARDMDTTAYFGTNPLTTSSWFYDVHVVDSTAGSVGLTGFLSVYITYYVKLMNPTVQAAD